MYLSRIALNMYRKNTIKALASYQILHSAVENSFPPSPEKAGRNLWRIDRLTNALYLLVLSNGKPDFSHIVDQFGWPGSDQAWEVKDYTPLLDQIKTGQKWQFRLRANPVRSLKQADGEYAQRGKVNACKRGLEQEQWLLDRANAHGFSLANESFHIVQQEEKQFRHHSNRETHMVTLCIATYEGILEVTDAAQFIHALTSGIGRAKAYGCGLLSIGRA